MLKLLDLFSGIGGFSLAASWTGAIETIAFCEIEPFCQKVLKKHWPDVPIFPDITKLRGDEVGTVDILTGGFPCQPFSCAGKQRGKADDRYLWPSMFRIIQETKPTWVIGENVPGIIDMGLEDCFLDLEDEGYEVQPLIIPACAINAPHRRDRVWIVGYSESARKRVRQQKRVDRQIFSETGRKQGVNLFNTSSQDAADTCSDTGNQWRTEPAGQQRPARTPDGGYDVADACRQGLQGTERDSSFKQRPGASRSTPQCSCFGGEYWSVEPDVGRVAHGIPDRVHRLKALGNSIVPQVVYPILQGIVDIERLEF